MATSARCVALLRNNLQKHFHLWQFNFEWEKTRIFLFQLCRSKFSFFDSFLPDLKLHFSSRIFYCYKKKERKTLQGTSCCRLVDCPSANCHQRAVGRKRKKKKYTQSSNKINCLSLSFCWSVPGALDRVMLSDSKTPRSSSYTKKQEWKS